MSHFIQNTELFYNTRRQIKSVISVRAESINAQYFNWFSYQFCFCSWSITWRLERKWKLDLDEFRVSVSESSSSSSVLNRCEAWTVKISWQAEAVLGSQVRGVAPETKQRAHHLGFLTISRWFDAEAAAGAAWSAQRSTLLHPAAALLRSSAGASAPPRPFIKPCTRSSPPFNWFSHN